MVVFKQQQLALAIALSLGSTAGIAAEAPTDKAEMFEEVVVTATPIRDSQKAAIMAKREADNFVDVISADTIGRFPDQSLAESLARVPALAVERDQGQARYVNFRGAPSRYTALSFNGLQLPGAENGRTPRFDSFPSVITRKITANKAIMPNMPGEAVSGYIDIETFDPFSQEGFATSLDMGMGEQKLGGGEIEHQSARLSWSNNNWGVLGYYSHNSREQVTDNREMDLELDAASGQRIAHELDFRSYLVEREDEAYGGRLEYRFDDGMTRIFAASQYNEFTDHELRNQYIFDLTAAGTPAPGDQGSVPVVVIDRMLQDGNYGNSTESHTLGADFEVADWLVETRINLAETENYVGIPIIRSAGGVIYGASYDVSDLEDPALELNGDLSDVSFAADIALPIDSLLVNESTKYKLDATREVSLFGVENTVQVGFQYDDRESEFKSSNGFVYLSGIDVNSFNTGKAWDSDFDHGVGGTYYDNAGLLAAWKASGTYPAPDWVTSDIDEDITSAYAMTTSHFGWGSLVYGARVEHTEFEVQAEGSKAGRSYTNVLPSIHWNYNLTEEQKLRASVTTGISRPTYTELHPEPNILAIRRSISEGNPDLDEEKTWGLDLSYEWYIGDSSLFSAGAFYRDIDNVIYSEGRTVDASDPEYGNFEGYTLTEVFNGKDGELKGVELNLIAHAEDFFDNSLHGFGISGNIAAVDSEFTTLQGATLSLPGTSDLTYNASLFYENEAFSLRLNYQYRDSFLTTAEGNDAEYWDEQERLDLSMRYSLPESLVGDTNVSLYLNANNLTDAVDSRYVGSEATPNQVERYGRRLMAGVRVTF